MNKIKNIMGKRVWGDFLIPCMIVAIAVSNYVPSITVWYVALAVGALMEVLVK